MNGDDEHIQAEVQSGKAQLLDWGGDLLTVVRQERKELVYCCVAGRSLKAWLPQLVSYAKQRGCKTIRLHPIRPGIVRLLRDLKPEKVQPGIYRIII